MTNDKTKLDYEIKQLQNANQVLQEKINELPATSSSLPAVTTAPTTRNRSANDFDLILEFVFFRLEAVPDEFLKLVEKAVEENRDLKNVLSERDREIDKLNEQLNQIHREDPEVVKQGLLQELTRLKSDFRTMFECQSNFFLQNLDRLKQAQGDNIAGFFKH